MRTAPLKIRVSMNISFNSKTIQINIQHTFADLIDFNFIIIPLWSTKTIFNIRTSRRIFSDMFNTVPCLIGVDNFSSFVDLSFELDVIEQNQSVKF